MSWIPFYADESDFQPLIEKLNREPQIAIIMPAGRARWIAVPEVEELPDGKYILWHVPGGPLPLLAGPVHAGAGVIADPFAGWTEPRTGPDPSVPFLGTPPYIFELRKATRGREFPDSIGLSSLGWIGNRYKSIGLQPAIETENWWRRIERWIKQRARQRMPRWDYGNHPRAEIRIFPGAHKMIQGGAARDANSHL